MPATVQRTCNGQSVGFCFGDVNPLAVKVNRRHGFGPVGNNGHIGAQANFLAVFGGKEAGLVFDAYGHDVILVFTTDTSLGYLRRASFCATD
ncbi:hypothetical protein D3C79_1044250 [compost metagenome]